MKEYMSAVLTLLVQGTLYGSPRNNIEASTVICPTSKAYLLGIVESFFHLRHDGVDVITFVNAWKQSTL